MCWNWHLDVSFCSKTKVSWTPVKRFLWLTLKTAMNFILVESDWWCFVRTLDWDLWHTCAKKSLRYANIHFILIFIPRETETEREGEGGGRGGGGLVCISNVSPTRHIAVHFYQHSKTALIRVHFKVSDLYWLECVNYRCWKWHACILTVSDQNGISLLYIMLGIHRSGLEPSIYFGTLNDEFDSLWKHNLITDMFVSRFLCEWPLTFLSVHIQTASRMKLW